MTDLVYDNNNYKVVVGNSIHTEPTIPCYQVVNKETKIVEVESSILPQAIQYASDFNDKLEETLEIVNKPENVITLN